MAEIKERSVKAHGNAGEKKLSNSQHNTHGKNALKKNKKIKKK